MFHSCCILLSHACIEQTYLASQLQQQIMKKLKNLQQRSPSPRNAALSNTNLQPLSSQRSKSNSQQLLKKYKQNIQIDLSKQSTIHNKYRIVTEPIDDHMLQMTQSYAKLSRPKRKDTKFDSQHNSIKSRQKTLSNEKYQPPPQHTCANCMSYQRQISLLKEQVLAVVSFKEQWKKGQIVLEEFAKSTESYREMGFDREAASTIQEVRKHFIDLMKDIEVLTDIDFPKLLDSNLLGSDDPISVAQDEIEIKMLLSQLRDQAQGRTTVWDLDEDNGNDNIRLVMRNLRTNYMHCVRQNLELRARQSSFKSDSKMNDEDIRRIISEIINNRKR